MTRSATLKLVNWSVLMGCFLLFSVAAVACGLGALMYAGTLAGALCLVGCPTFLMVAGFCLFEAESFV